MFSACSQLGPAEPRDGFSGPLLRTIRSRGSRPGSEWPRPLPGPLGWSATRECRQTWGFSLSFGSRFGRISVILQRSKGKDGKRMYELGFKLNTSGGSGMFRYVQVLKCDVEKIHTLLSSLSPAAFSSVGEPWQGFQINTGGVGLLERDCPSDWSPCLVQCALRILERPT